MQIRNFSAGLVSLSIIVLILIYAQSIIIPFIFALLIWFIVKKFRNLIDKIPFIHQYIPTWIKTLITSVLIFGILTFISMVLIENIERLSRSYVQYASNIELIGAKINTLFSVDLQDEIISTLNDFNFSDYLQSLLNSISGILGTTVMISFYVVFLFIEESLFSTKMRLIFTDSNQYLNFLQTMKKVDKSLASYMSLKSLISIITTTLSYFILLGVGIDSPLFWAFLIFIFNFIPSVGPILGTILPALFSLIQFGEFTPFLIILFSVGTVAMLVGSLLEPRLMGNTLNISPLVAILSLAIWGAMWGITGMLLSVPITVAMIIVLAQFPSTRSIAILLSEKGQV